MAQLVSLQWICVPFVLMNPHTVDISQTLMNNSFHAPWIGELQPSRVGVFLDDFICFVREDYYSLVSDIERMFLDVSKVSICDHHVTL